jgi:hypothetical protein
VLLDPDPHPDPHHCGNLDPYPDLHPHQVDKLDPDPRKLKLGIRIKAISRIRNTVSQCVDCSKKFIENLLNYRTTCARSGSAQKAGSGSVSSENSDPDPDSHPHQIKIRIRIRIKAMRIRNTGSPNKKY